MHDNSHSPLQCATVAINYALLLPKYPILLRIVIFYASDSLFSVVVTVVATVIVVFVLVFFHFNFDGGGGDCCC